MRGSIRKRGKDSWEITVDLGRGPDGRRLRKFVAVQGRRADADRRLRDILASVDKGLPLDNSKLTVAEYLARWHQDYVKANTRPRTQERYEGDIRNHLVPHLGRLPLTKVTPSDVQRMETAMLARGLSPRTVQHAHRILSEAFKHALGWGLVWQNPCQSVRPPRRDTGEVSIPDVPAVNRLLELVQGSEYYPVFHLLAFTGMRRGEVCALKWEDVDLERGMIYIRQSLGRVRGQGLVLAPPKSARGRRAITIGPETVAVLRAHRGAQLLRQAEFAEVYQNRGFVFTRPLGEPLNPDTLSKAWHTLTLRAGAPGIRLHDLRHFHASMLLKAGTNPKVVQERLGHSTIAITLDIYSHVVPGLQERAALAFEDAMRVGAEKGS